MNVPTKRMAIHKLILDWNGTVMADLDRSWHVTNLLLTDVGAPPLTLAQFQERFTLPMARFFADVAVPAYRIADVERRWSELSATKQAPLAPGARALLERCRLADVEVGVLTGADPALIRADAQHHGIDSMLAWVDGPSLDKRHVLAAIAERNGEGGVAYVGDTTHDISSAQSAGLISVGVLGGYTPEQRIRAAEPDVVIDALSSLLPYIPATKS
ncbi:MAG: HAD family hydrolase [Acidobacteria bacterium]|nr:HAD family hydrolase [Acidobacteriota bacterium]